MVVGIKSPFEEQAQSLSSGNMIIKHRNLPTIKTIDQEMTRNPETLYELKIFDFTYRARNVHGTFWGKRMARFNTPRLDFSFLKSIIKLFNFFKIVKQNF